MTSAARMQRSLERRVLEAEPWSRRSDDGDDREAAAHATAIDDVLRAVEREESWPHFINVLRARGSELRERMLGLVARPHDEGPRALRRPLVARLAAVGLGEESRALLDHAQRVMARARALSLLLDDDADALLRFPRAREHVLDGENAAWMHTFALVLLARVASGTTAIERPSTDLAVTLAVDAARDACAHWSTALELLAENHAA